MHFKKNTIAAVICSMLAFSPALAAVVESKGKSEEVSIKESGGLVKARKAAKKMAERDAVFATLKLRMNVDKKNPAAQEAIDDMVKQFSDKFVTTYKTDDDLVEAQSVLSVEGEELFDLARSIDGLMSGTATSSSKILFLIDEYFGIATELEKGQVLSTEISYKHDKSKASSSSRSSADASSSKDAIAVSGASKSSVAASDSSSISARDKAAVAGSQKTNVAVADGYGGAGSASRDTRIAGSSESSLDASRKSSFAGSSQSSFAGAASSERASASSSASASAASQKDTVNYSFKQTFPGIDNAKPADGASAMIPQGLQSVVKQFGLEFVAERDIRVDPKAGKLLIRDLEKQRKFDWVTQKAAKAPFSANYIVYGEAVMNAEGKTSSGDTTCSGKLALTSFNVGTGDGLVADTLESKAQGSSDQNCRNILSSALAKQVAEVIGLKASQDIQRKATQGESFYVSLYSSKKIKSSILLAFPDQLKGIAKEMKEDLNKANGWNVKAKDGFIGKLRIIVAQLSEENPDARKAEVFVNGGKILVSIDGTKPKDL